jgi:hypothetical protein
MLESIGIVETLAVIAIGVGSLCYGLVEAAAYGTRRSRSKSSPALPVTWLSGSIYWSGPIWTSFHGKSAESDRLREVKMRLENEQDHKERQYDWVVRFSLSRHGDGAERLLPASHGNLHEDHSLIRQGRHLQPRQECRNQRRADRAVLRRAPAALA